MHIEPIPMTPEQFKELKSDLNTKCEFARQDAWKSAFDKLEEVRNILIYSNPLTDADIARIKYLFLAGWSGDFHCQVEKLCHTKEEYSERCDKIRTLASLIDLS